MIVVVGIPGAGKTSVLNEIIKIRNDLKIVNFGDIISKIAIEKKIVKHRDEINYLPVRIHRKIQTATVNEIKKIEKIEEKKKKILIIDTHAVMRKKEGFFPGISPEFLKLKIIGFVLIDAPSEEILERRRRDVTRKRELISSEIIDEHRKITMWLISSYSATTGAPFFVIQNKNKRLEEAVKKLNFIIDYLK